MLLEPVLPGSRARQLLVDGQGLPVPAGGLRGLPRILSQTPQPVVGDAQVALEPVLPDPARTSSSADAQGLPVQRVASAVCPAILSQIPQRL